MYVYKGYAANGCTKQDGDSALLLCVQIDVSELPDAYNLFLLHDPARFGGIL